jgi:hypothetical protein
MYPEALDITDEDIEVALEEMFVLEQSRVERGVGYCDNVECTEYCKGMFLWHHEGPFICRLCHREGFVAPEAGRAERELGKFFGEVRVQFAYIAALRDYTQVAIIRDDNLGPDCGIYYMQAPTCVTDKRAFDIGERLLSVLNDGVYLDADLSVPPAAHERVLDLDKPMEEVRAWLAAFEVRIRGNPFFSSEPKEGLAVFSQGSGDLKHEGEERGS